LAPGVSLARKTTAEEFSREGKQIMWNAKSTLTPMAPSTSDRTASEVVDNGERVVARPNRQAGQQGGRKRWYRSLAALTLLLSAGVAYAQYGYPQYSQPPPSQYPLMDEVADRFVQRYCRSSCEQLWQKREQPRSQREQEAIQALRNDPQMRAVFINRVAAPVANKMFECGMIP
jgi:hypothetical protein